MYGYDNYYDEQIYEPTPLDELFGEYREKCKTLLLASVQSEIDGIKNENNRLTEENNRLRNEVRSIDKLKRDFERDKDNYIKQGIENYQREALSGLRCGDTVWTIATETETENCKHCNGTHKIEVDVAGILKQVDCPHCGYNGKTTIDITYTPVKRVITQINTSLWYDNKAFKRHLYFKEEKGCNDTADDEVINDDSYGSNSGVSETNQYSRDNSVSRGFWLTEEECLIECNNRKEKWLKEHKAN